MSSAAAILPPKTDAVEADERNLWLERINVASDGKRFKAHFMTPGVIDYTDVPGGGRELLRKPTIDEGLESLIGAPLTIGHIDIRNNDFDGVSHGTVDKVYFDAAAGWYCAEGTVETEIARNNIAAGWGISVGTKVRRSDFGPGGTWLHAPYDREIGRLKFHHLALIEPGRTPRFEDAEARLNAVNKSKSMFSIFRKKAGAKPGETVDESIAIDPKARLNIGGGKTATAEELVSVARENAVHAIGQGDYLECGGFRYDGFECIRAYNEKMEASARPNAVVIETAEAKAQREAVAAAAKKLADEEVARANAVAAEKAEKDRLAEVARLNEAAVAKKKADDEARENALREAGSKSFAELAQAQERRKEIKIAAPSSSLAAKVARGKELFGGN